MDFDPYLMFEILVARKLHNTTGSNYQVQFTLGLFGDNES